MNPLPPDLAAITKALVERHACHTVLLYGSHARGEGRPTSDYDVAAICKEGDVERDARPVDGLVLDGFVYGEAKLATLEPSALRFLGGRLLLDVNGFGRDLLARVEAMMLAGPKPLPESERIMLEMWSQKMLERIAEGGVEAHHRRAQLLYEIPEVYFRRRRIWFKGPRESFGWLRDNDPRTYDALERALDPAADLAAIRALVERVNAEKA